MLIELILSRPIRRLLSFVGIVFIVAVAASAAEPVEMGTRLEPLVDDHLIASLHNVKQTLHEPIRR
ncbi:MAG: hypothetical protein O3C40_32935, partial [Planctomycetota bacterium]|nr:hypothetical protein [Planctomycetota bacterium]